MKTKYSFSFHHYIPNTPLDLLLALFLFIFQFDIFMSYSLDENIFNQGQTYLSHYQCAYHKVQQGILILHSLSHPFKPFLFILSSTKPKSCHQIIFPQHPLALSHTFKYHLSHHHTFNIILVIDNPKPCLQLVILIIYQPLITPSITLSHHDYEPNWTLSKRLFEESPTK